MTDFVEIEDDEEFILGWEVMEAKYGRELTEEEVRKELKSEYEDEFLDLELYAKEFEEDVARYQEWLAFKADEQHRESEQNDEKSAHQQIAEELHYALCSPPIGDDDEISDDDFDQWVEGINLIIKEKLDFYSILRFGSLVRKDAARHSAAMKADKRHEENRSMKAEAFEWIDANSDQFKSLDSMAEAIAGKVVPVAFRTARKWVGEHKKLRSAGTE